jgi:vanillate O-demethylase ferredoxin subunit
MDVIEVQGRIDHHDVFLGPAERAANHRICACVSRVRGGVLVLDTAFRPDPR